VEFRYHNSESCQRNRDLKNIREDDSLANYEMENKISVCIVLDRIGFNNVTIREGYVQAILYIYKFPNFILVYRNSSHRLGTYEFQ
jgi:hypothetical protein